MLDLRRGYTLLRQTLKKYTGDLVFRRVGWGVIFFLATVLIIGSSFFSRGFSFKEGQVCPTNIYAPRTIVYVDEVETERLRHDAISRVEKSYQEDTGVISRLEEKVNNTFDKIRELRDTEIQPAEKVQRLRTYLAQEVGIPTSELETIPTGSLESLLQGNEQELAVAESLSITLLQEELRYGLKDDALPSAKESIAKKVSHSSISEEWKPVVSAVLVHTIRPNLVFDSETYERRVAQAEAEVPVVERTYKAGQVIVREGDIITKAHLAVLRQLGLMRGRTAWPQMLGVTLFVLLIGILIVLYLYRSQREILECEQYLILYGLLFTLTMLIAKAVSVITISPRPEIASLVGYLLPVAGGAILISILLDKGLAVFTAFIFSILVGVMTNGQLSFALVGFVGSMAGIFGIGTNGSRSDVIRGGVFVSLANVGMILILGLLNETPLGMVLAGMGMGVLNGIICSILALGSLPYLEGAFGITSSVRLLELSNPSQPLLKRLLLEAPGTYHHSILVGNLAEAAAEAVQADPLLVRVGSYYHDIGKLKRPYFFIENQLSRENPHDKIAPSLSTLIITSHVKDGLELAREHKLPPDIQGIIEQHHGTSLVAYFYHKALESDRPELVSEEEFRYDSVKPQSKEAALVMLADSVEAAIRSLQKPTPGRLEGLTRKIIKDKLHDGQLEECDLTFKDLDKIAVAFVRVLGGIFHSRIEYPDAALITELERRKPRGAAVNQ
ncbi:MAG: HDIG domain-containing metalloprotein [Syntrophaceticus sp.]